MDTRVIGEREFTDGVVRQVYEDDENALAMRLPWPLPCQRRTPFLGAILYVIGRLVDLFD